jgi:hypothetical protein
VSCRHVGLKSFGVKKITTRNDRRGDLSIPLPSVNASTRSEYLSKKTIHCPCSLRSALPVPFDDRIDGGFDGLSPIMRAALEKSVRIRDKAPPTCRHLSLNGRNPILVVLLDLLHLCF